MSVRRQDLLIIGIFLTLLLATKSVLSSEKNAAEFGQSGELKQTHSKQVQIARQCDLAVSFLPTRKHDGLVFTNPGLLTLIPIKVENVGVALCPKKTLKLLRYRGRQGWVAGQPLSIPALLPGGIKQLRWWVNPQQTGYYTYKPQFVGGLIDANPENHSPAKKFRAIFRTHD